MATNTPAANLEREGHKQADWVADAIGRELAVLSSIVASLVRSMERSSSRTGLAQRVEDVVGEVACRAISQLHGYDPDRPLMPWLIGIARNVIRGEARNAARRPGRTEVDEPTWERLVGVIQSMDGPTSDRIDLEAAWMRLPDSHRMVLECRFWKSLDGQDLAEAIAAPTAGAARVRVTRAVQALRSLLTAGAPEVDQ